MTRGSRRRKPASCDIKRARTGAEIGMAEARILAPISGFIASPAMVLVPTSLNVPSRKTRPQFFRRPVSCM